MLDDLGRQANAQARYEMAQSVEVRYGRYIALRY